MELNHQQLREYIIKMAGLVETQLANSLSNQSLPHSESVLTEQIKDYYSLIDDISFKYLALQAPSAKDLRSAIAMMKINLILRNISLLSSDILTHYNNCEHSYLKLEEIGKTTHQILQKSIDALSYYQAITAREVFNDIKIIGLLHDELLEQLLYASDREHLGLVQSVNAVIIARLLKQINSSCGQIANQVIFVEEGSKQIKNNHPQLSGLKESKTTVLNKYLKKEIIQKNPSEELS